MRKNVHPVALIADRQHDAGYLARNQRSGDCHPRTPSARDQEQWEKGVELFLDRQGPEVRYGVGFPGDVLSDVRSVGQMPPWGRQTVGQPEEPKGEVIERKNTQCPAPVERAENSAGGPIVIQ